MRDLENEEIRCWGALKRQCHATALKAAAKLLLSMECFECVDLLDETKNHRKTPKIGKLDFLLTMRAPRIAVSSTGL